MALLMLIWVFSGIFLLYSEFPEWKNKDQISYNNELNKTCLVELDSIHFTSKEINIYNQFGKPIIHYGSDSGRKVLIDNNNELHTLSEQYAIKIASKIFALDSSNVSSEKINKPDIWLDKKTDKLHFPVFKLSFNDELKSEIYVSSKNGEILQNTNRIERLIAWIGAIPHLIYFKDFSSSNFIWKWILFFLSGLGSIMSIFGLVTGLIRFKKKKKKRKKSKLKYTPYGSRLYSIHHYLGFVFGVFAFTWIFSGFMSLEPLSFFLDKSEEVSLKTKWNDNFAIVDELPNFQLMPFSSGVKNINLKKYRNNNIIILSKSDNEKYRLNNDLLVPRNNQLLINDFKSKIKNVYNISEENISILYEYDNYYYKKNREKVLPVVKVNFDNTIKSDFYFDPLTLEIVKTTNRISRINRWLYKALHRFDFIKNKSIWYLVMWILLLGGFFLALTANLFYFRKKIKKANK